MKAYLIVRAGSFDDLQQMVEEFVVEGYTPVGSPGIMMSSYVQAIYLKGIAEMFEQEARAKSSKHIIPDHISHG